MATQLFLSSADIQEWCSGLPLIGERQLTVEEEGQLREEMRRCGRQSWNWGCAAPLVFLLAVAFAAGVSEWTGHNSSVQGALTVLVILCTFLFPAIFFLRANDYGRRRSTAKKDLSHKHIKIYAAVPNELWGHNPDAVDETNPETSVPIGGLEVAPNELVTLEVFSKSRRLWRVNGQQAHGLTTLPMVEVASVPQQARAASAWAQKAVKTSDGHYDISGAPRRDLSQSEREELQRGARTIWRRPLLSALLLSAWIGVPLAIHLATDTPIQAKPLAYFISALALWCDYVLWKKGVLAWKWSRDTRVGFVYVVQMPFDEEPGDSAAPPENATVLELLPHSRWVWTINNRSAPWRMESM